MGLGKLLSPREVEHRTITEFAIIDGVSVNGSGEAASRYRGGMSIPGAWRAATLLANLLGGIPWHAFRSLGGRPVELLDPNPPLLEQPNPPDTRMTSFSSLALDLLWHGNAIGIIASRNTFGWPTSFLPVPAEQVGVRRVGPNSFSPLPVGALEYSIGGLTFGSFEVIHIKGPCAPGALRGMGVVEAHMETITLSREQIKQASSIAQAGVPTGILESTSETTTKEQLKEAKKFWLEQQANGRTIMATLPSAKFTPVAWNPEELQLVEARKFSLTDWENIFGLPAGWLGGATNSRVYTNVELDAINLLKFGSPAGHVAQFEQTLSLAFPRGTTVKANLDALMRASTKERYEAHGIALDKGFKMPSEVRQDEDLPPIAGLDEAWLERIKRGPLQAQASTGRDQPPPDPAPPWERRSLRIRGHFRHLPGRHPQDRHGGDALNLASRIKLGPGEKLVSSRELKLGTGSDLAILQAVLDTPSGRQMRLGLVPHEDRRKWAASDRGGTIRLDKAGAEALRNRLVTAEKAGKAFSARIDAMENRPEAEQDWSLLGEEITAGELPGGDWGDLVFHLDGNLGGEPDWLAWMAVRPPDAGADWEPDLEVALYPRDLRALIKSLDLGGSGQ